MSAALLSRKMLSKIAFPIAICMTLFQFYFTIGYSILDGTSMSAIFVGFAFILIFLTIPIVHPKEGKEEPKILLCLDLFLVAATIGVVTFLVLNLPILFERMLYIDPVPEPAIWAGFILIALTFEATRRTTGLALCTVAGTFLLYLFFGDQLPRAVAHNGVTIENIVETLTIQSEGIFGIPIQTATSMLFSFMMFGAFLEKSNMSSLFMDMACRITRKSQGGAAKVAIFASALFGTISGSSAGNVYTTGVFTIPLMKRAGYTPHFAGAVEAVASTGGQIMPPVMGAAAFILAELAGVGYLDVAKAAAIPAVLYFLALYMMIHFEAKKHNLGTLDDEHIPPWSSILRRLYYFAPLMLLISLMLYGRSVAVCANAATLSIIILSFFSKETRFTFRRFLDALATAAKSSLMVVACCACSGIVVGTINFTGIGFKFINMITLIAGNSLFLMLILILLTSFIIGMGMPTTPAYIVVATLGAPALIKMGIAPIVAHLFVFYYAIISFITPPVCLAAYAAAAIAHAKPMQTGLTSMKLGIVAFIVPMVFIYEPAILAQGSTIDIVNAFATAVIGVMGVSAGLQGWYLRDCSLIEQGVLIAGGSILFYPGFYTDVIGLTILALVAIKQLIQNRNDVKKVLVISHH